MREKREREREVGCSNVAVWWCAASCQIYFLLSDTCQIDVRCEILATCPIRYLSLADEQGREVTEGKMGQGFHMPAGAVIAREQRERASERTSARERVCERGCLSLSSAVARSGCAEMQITCKVEVLQTFTLASFFIRNCLQQLHSLVAAR